MARRRYRRAASALTQLSKSKQDAKFRDIEAQGIRAGTEAKVAKMNQAFDLAGQALVTADALAQEYKTRGKVEKGVTSLAEAKGGDVSYKKTGLKDIFIGEAKLSDWGKESWTIGEDKAQYDRADILAFEEKGRKDLKWDSVIGKEVTKYDEKTQTTSKTRVKTDAVKPKEYKIQGEAELFGIEGMEKKYGKGWSYKKQKAMSKMTEHQKTGDDRGLLQSQVASNVESTNYGTISKAYKKEFSGTKGYSSETMKALDLKHESWKKKQTPERLKKTDDVQGVVKSAKSAQEGTAYKDPSEFGININPDTSSKDKEFRRKQLLTDEEIVAEGKAMHEKEMSELAPPKKDYWGERKGIDAWEKFKEKRSQSKARKEIQSLLEGDDYVSPDELEKNEIKKSSASFQDIDFDAPSMDKDTDFKDASGQTLQVARRLNEPEFVNMGGTMRTEGYAKDNPYYKPEAEPSGNFAGTAEQNINLLNTMARQKFQEDSPGSSLGGTFDFNVASSGGYDSTAYTLRGNNENVDALSSQELDERGIVMDYPDINLKGLNVKQTWDKLGIGGWDDRASLWDKYMSGGA